MIRKTNAAHEALSCEGGLQSVLWRWPCSSPGRMVMSHKHKKGAGGATPLVAAEVGGASRPAAGVAAIRAAARAAAEVSARAAAGEVIVPAADRVVGKATVRVEAPSPARAPRPPAAVARAWEGAT